MAERRQVGPNGPQPITVEAMHAYVQLTGYAERRYKEQILRFIPALDRTFLADFYTKQQKEMDEAQRKHEAKNKLQSQSRNERRPI